MAFTSPAMLTCSFELAIPPIPASSSTLVSIVDVFVARGGGQRLGSGANGPVIGYAWQVGGESPVNIALLVAPDDPARMGRAELAVVGLAASCETVMSYVAQWLTGDPRLDVEIVGVNRVAGEPDPAPPQQGHRPLERSAWVLKLYTLGVLGLFAALGYLAFRELRASS